MARAYTVAASCFWDDAQFGGGTARQGADTYTLNDQVALTIDTDTRTCANSSEGTGCAGNITITSRASLIIDGSAVRLIPYNTGSGNVPAIGTSVSQGGVSGALLGVWSALNVAPTAVGAAMPASGYIKLRSASGAFAAGALTGIGASATGADVVGWIEVVGVEASSILAAGTTGLGTFQITGAWFEAGTTPGTPSTSDTYQLPAPYDKTYYGGVWVETSAGSGVYDRWPLAGVIGTTYAVPANELAADARGRCCWISSQGLLRFGTDGTLTGGELPQAGCKIRVPNVILSNTTSAATSTFTVGANVTPNTTVTTRYKNNGAVLLSDLQYFNSAWYISPQGPAFQQRHCTYLDKNTGSPLYGCVYTLQDAIFTESGYVNPAFNYTTDVTATYGVDWTDVVFAKFAAANTVMILRGAPSGTMTRPKFHSLKTRTATLIGLYLNGVSNLVIDNPTLINCFINSDGNGYTINDIVYADTILGTVGTANPHTIFNGGTSANVRINGLTWLIATANTCHPRTGVAAFGENSSVRNIGSYASPLPVGTANPMQVISGSSLNLHRRDRIYLTAGSGFTVSDTMQSLFDKDVRVDVAVYALTRPNGTARGVIGTPDISNSNPGGHISASFINTTDGWIGCSPSFPSNNPVSTEELSYGSGVVFVDDGAILSTVDDHWVMWKFPWKIKGYTAFNGAPTIRGASTPANFYIEVSIDKGVTWTKAKGTDGSTSLASLDISDYAGGFNLWVRIICKAFTTLAAAKISTIKFPMTTTATAVQTQCPLEEIQFTDTGALNDSLVAWIAPGGASVFDSYVKSGSGQTAQYDNQDGTEKTGSYRVRLAGYGAIEGAWTETTSWYRDTKTYYVVQAAEFPVAVNSATALAYTGIALDGVAKTNVLSSSHSFQEWYDYCQHWSCQVAKILQDVPITSILGNTFTQAAGWTLTGVENLTGSKTVAGGTVMIDAPGTITTAFADCTLELPEAGTYTFTASGTQINLTPTEDSPPNYVLGGCTLPASVDFDNNTAFDVTVELPTGVSGVDLGSGGVITFTAPATYQSVTISGFTVGSRVQIYDTDDDTELYNDVPGASPLVWTDPDPAAATRPIRVRVAYVSGATAKEFIEANIGTCATSGAGKDISYLVAQVNDATYNTNVIDGSGVADIDFTDAATDLIVCDIAGGAVTWPTIYAAFVYWLSTATGIADDITYIEAPDTANYLLTSMKIRNSSSTPLTITGGYGRDATSGLVADIIDTIGSTGNIYPSPDHVVPFSTGSGLTAGQAAQLTAIEGATGSSGEVRANVIKMNSAAVAGTGQPSDLWRGA